MSDLLIKGMEMPKTCDDCILAEQGSWLGAQEGWEHFCIADCDELRTVYHGEKPEWCPLVEVPTPHGRLIDADEVCYQLEKQATIDGQPRAIRRARRIVADAPTIIEAEEGE